MKKLLLLLPVTMLALAGCNTPAGGGTEPGGGGEGGGGGGGQPSGGTTYVINKEAIASHIEEGKTYPTADFEFLVEGVKFEANTGVGLKNAEDEGKGNGYNELGLMQIRNNDGGHGIIRNAEAVSVSKVTIEWYNTYATEAADYIPQVFVSDSYDGTFDKVSANESAPQTGEKTNYVQVGGDNKDHEVYKYVTTYNVPSGKSFLKVTHTIKSASYWKTVTLA